MTNNKVINKWSVSSSVLAFDVPWAKVRHDVCTRPDGTVIDDYFYWEGGDFAKVISLTKCNEVVLTRQYKHGVSEIVIELPAGGIEAKEDPLEAAKRELLEETGYTAAEWYSLGVLNVSSAKATTRAYPFLALGAVYCSPQNCDEHEVIEVSKMPLNDVITMAVNGKMRDSNSLAAILLALHHEALIRATKG